MFDPYSKKFILKLITACNLFFICSQTFAPLSYAQSVLNLPAPGDKAMTVEDLEGIDLNSENWNLEKQGYGLEKNFIFDTKSFENIQVDGFVPVILNVVPITNLPLLLGLNDVEDDV